MRNSASTLARALEPLAAGLWVSFILVSIVVAAAWGFAITDTAVEKSIQNSGLRSALNSLLRYLDLAWIVLAAANAYLALAARHGLPRARRWILFIMLAVALLAGISVWTGLPLGHIRYGAVLGPKLCSVPLGLLFLWFAIIVGLREGLARIFPRWSHLQIALGTAFTAMLTDLSLEPLASKLRGFWFWRSETPELPPSFDAPLASCLVWGALAGLLAFALRETSVVVSARLGSWRPAVIIAIFHLVFISGHLGRWVRG